MSVVRRDEVGERDWLVERLLSLSVRAWDDQDSDSAVEVEKLCKAQIAKWAAIEAAARVVINESYVDGFGGVCNEIIDELRVCGVHEAIDALRAALGEP